MRMTRVLLACLAAVACAWFVIGARQAHESDAAAAIVGATVPRSAAQLSHAQSAIGVAGFLYPGQDIRLLRVQQLIDQRRYADAEETVQKVLRAEPQNLQGWIALAKVFILAPRIAARTGLTPAQVKAHIARLDPVDASRL